MTEINKQLDEEKIPVWMLDSRLAPGTSMTYTGLNLTEISNSWTRLRKCQSGCQRSHWHLTLLETDLVDQERAIKLGHLSL